jgi:hypothetical protein
MLVNEKSKTNNNNNASIENLLLLQAAQQLAAQQNQNDQGYLNNNNNNNMNKNSSTGLFQMGARSGSSDQSILAAEILHQQQQLQLQHFVLQKAAAVFAAASSSYAPSIKETPDKSSDQTKYSNELLIKQYSNYLIQQQQQYLQTLQQSENSNQINLIGTNSGGVKRPMLKFSMDAILSSENKSNESSRSSPNKRMCLGKFKFDLDSNLKLFYLIFALYKQQHRKRYQMRFGFKQTIKSTK